MAAALLLDNVIAQAASHHYWQVKHHSTIAEVIKEMGRYRVMSGVVVLLCLFHARRWRAGVLVLASCATGGLIEVMLKWAAGRERPVQGDTVLIDPFALAPFRGGLSGFLTQNNLCFPSGHTTLVFAMAACLAYLIPRGKGLWYALAVIVGIERLAELAHYSSDVVGGAICGVLSFHLVKRGFGALDRARSLPPTDGIHDDEMSPSSPNREMSY